MTTPKLDRIIGFSRQLVGEAGAIALETNDRIDAGTFDYATWAKSMLKLWDLGLAGGAELAPDMFMPCFPCIPGTDEPEYSEVLHAPSRDVARKAHLVSGSFVHDGAPSFGIPDFAISVEPPMLQPHATQFRIAVSWPGLRSGTYRGTVRFLPESTTNVVIDDIVQVIIDL